MSFDESLCREVCDRDDMNDSLFDIIRPVIEHLHDQIRLTRSSQYNLNQCIDNLSQRLKEIGYDECAPYDLDLFVRKLENSMARINSTESSLKDIHDRLSRLQRQIARETYQQKQRLSQIPPSPPAH